MDKEALIEKYKPKLEAEELEYTDLPEVMQLMELVANEDEDFEEEFEGFSKRYLFAVSDKPDAEWMHLIIEDGKFKKVLPGLYRDLAKI